MNYVYFRDDCSTHEVQEGLTCVDTELVTHTDVVIALLAGLVVGFFLSRITT